MIFKRKIYDKLKEWKIQSNGKTAVMVEGARRVGKSTIVKEFAKNEYKSYIIIEFDQAPKEEKDIFDYIHDLDYFFARLQLLHHTDLYNRKSVIVFDEVQLFPKARQAIKRLVEDGRYDYIETGSLISIKKNVENILIPSEERTIQMNPMDYEEFLWAFDDYTTNKQLKLLYDLNRPIGDIHRKLMHDFRLYMLIGGMPQAVREYIETHNFKNVDMIKRDIIKLYEDDLYKIDSSGRLVTILEAIPSQLNKNSNSFKTRSVIGSYKISENSLLNYIAELKSSKIVNVAYSVNDPNIGLASSYDMNKYKLYLLDTGLFVTLLFKDRDFTENIIYEKLLSNSLSANLGYLYENMMAQILVSKGDDLYYNVFSDKEKKINYEVDFLLSRKNKICPIEVKSSKYRVHPSIDKFYSKYSSRILQRYIVHTKDISKDKDIICLPIYLSQFL